MHGYAAYQKTQNVAENPRLIERRLIGTVTGALLRARENPTNLAELIEALLWNKRVWDHLLNEAAADDNRLPTDLRGGLVKLAVWVGGETQRILDGESDTDTLIEVNQTVMEGLS
ncbi:MAG: flagellar biosynthesis regulator FlaF [Proteobacteria bacterium]|nr:flagellar biosynthesis regulator FlaF [Pseudomonadota bacterium]